MVVAVGYRTIVIEREATALWSIQKGIVSIILGSLLQVPSLNGRRLPAQSGSFQSTLTARACSSPIRLRALRNSCSRIVSVNLLKMIAIKESALIQTKQ